MKGNKFSSGMTQKCVTELMQNLNFQFVLMVGCSLRMPFGSGHSLSPHTAYLRSCLACFICLGWILSG